MAEGQGEANSPFTLTSNFAVHPAFIQLEHVLTGGSKSSSRSRSSVSNHAAGHSVSQHVASMSSDFLLRGSDRSTRRDRLRSRLLHALERAHARRRAQHQQQQHRLANARDAPRGHFTFGCGPSRTEPCVCPLPLSASFFELQAEAERLKAKQELMLSHACYQAALDMYLSRVGRYYVDPKDMNGGAGEGSEAPLPAPSASPIPLPSDIDSRASAKVAGQQIAAKIDAMATPPAGWTERFRRPSPHMAAAKRLERLSSQPDEKELMKHEREAWGEDVAVARARAAAAMRDQRPQRAAWTPPDPTSDEAKLIAQMYDQQLRKQWKTWEEESKQHEMEGVPRKTKGR